MKQTIQDKTNSKSGFTLVELIVTIAILSVVLATIYSLFQFGSRSFSLSRDNAESQFEVRMPTDFIAKNIRFADTLEIITAVPASNPTNPNEYYVYLDNGQLLYKDNNGTVIIPGTESRTDFTFAVNRKINTSNVVTLAIGKTGTNIFDLVTDVTALNLTQNIAGTSGIGMKFRTDRAEGITPANIVSLIDPPLISIPISSDLNMPNRVSAVMTNGTIRQVAVRWHPTIDTTTEGLKTSTGRVVGYNGTATFTVFVGSLDIVYVYPPGEITLNKNEPFTMPATLVADVSDGTNTYTQNVDVASWDTIITTDTVDTYTAEATVTGYEPDPLVPEDALILKVTVIDQDISSINPNPIYVTVDQGESFELPDEVSALMTDGSFKFVGPVAWNPDTLDTMTTGTKNSTGTVTYSGSTHSVQLTLTVTQIKLPIPSGQIIKTSSGNSSSGEVWVWGTVGSTARLKNSNGDVLYSGVIGADGVYKFTSISTKNLDHAILQMSGWLDSDPYDFN
ncbi:MAG: Ig-like domain-containing protein [Bacillota bacterium]|nr:Ig-like domain-containing protein [Bacillota bacterium]